MKKSNIFFAFSLIIIMVFNICSCSYKPEGSTRSTEIATEIETERPIKIREGMKFISPVITENGHITLPDKNIEKITIKGPYGTGGMGSKGSATQSRDVIYFYKPSRIDHIKQVLSEITVSSTKPSDYNDIDGVSSWSLYLDYDDGTYSGFSVISPSYDRLTVGNTDYYIAENDQRRALYEAVCWNPYPYIPAPTSRPAIS